MPEPAGAQKIPVGSVKVRNLGARIREGKKVVKGKLGKIGNSDGLKRAAVAIAPANANGHRTASSLELLS
jgi:hypothetical protein